MGIFGTKEKNYDNEIALINQKQNELAKITDKNKSDVVALGLDFSEYKETIGNQLNEVWNFMNTLSLIYDWYSTMLSYIGEENYEENIIDIEMEEN